MIRLSSDEYRRIQYDTSEVKREVKYNLYDQRTSIDNMMYLLFLLKVVWIEY